MGTRETYMRLLFEKDVLDTQEILDIFSGDEIYDEFCKHGNVYHAVVRWFTNAIELGVGKDLCDTRIMLDTLIQVVKLCDDGILEIHVSAIDKSMLKLLEQTLFKLTLAATSFSTQKSYKGALERLVDSILQYFIRVEPTHINQRAKFLNLLDVCVQRHDNTLIPILGGLLKHNLFNNPASIEAITGNTNICTSVDTHKEKFKPRDIGALARAIIHFRLPVLARLFLKKLTRGYDISKLLYDELEAIA